MRAEASWQHRNFFNPEGAVTLRGVAGTLVYVLDIEAAGQVHFHLIGAYLNKLGGNGAVIPDVAITVEGILNIWSEYVTKGFYEPTAGVKWYAEDIKTYLISNGMVK